MYLCRCDCGNEKSIRADSLKGGSIQSCGCLLKESTSKRYLKNLTGQRFGRWIVLERVNSINKISKWRCQCDCGVIKDVFANVLLNGTSKSCGCLTKDSAHENNFIDLTGMKFSLLQVIERYKEDYKSKSGSSAPQWICKCDCGNICIALGCNLRAGTKTSCGCVNKRISHGEQIIKSILEGNNILFVYQKKFIDCRDISILPFDFYLPDYNICIEYDGQQHFKPIDYFGGEKSFEYTKKHDKIKNDYCKNNNIKIIRVPYTLNYLEIKQRILNILNP